MAAAKVQRNFRDPDCGMLEHGGGGCIARLPVDEAAHIIVAAAMTTPAAAMQPDWPGCRRRSRCSDP